MSATEAFNIYAYAKNDTSYETDERRDGVPFWNLETVVRRFLDNGLDTILIEKHSAPAPWTDPNVTHHVCNDPTCPGGCE